MTLLFYVNNQSLSLNPQQKEVVVASDSKNYLKASFAFYTNEWRDGTLVYALFTHNDKTYKKYLGVEEGCKKNECFVAPEVIKTGKFSVSLFCDDRITTNKVDIPVQNSGYTENIVNENATPSTKEQLETLMYRYASLCNEMVKEC